MLCFVYALTFTMDVSSTPESSTKSISFCPFTLVHIWRPSAAQWWISINMHLREGESIPSGTASWSGKPIFHDWMLLLLSTWSLLTPYLTQYVSHSISHSIFSPLTISPQMPAMTQLGWVSLWAFVNSVNFVLHKISLNWASFDWFPIQFPITVRAGARFCLSSLMAESRNLVSSDFFCRLYIM